MEKWGTLFRIGIGLGGLMFLSTTVLAYVRYLRKWWLREMNRPELQTQGTETETETP